MAEDIIKLNVGGKVFMTTRATLTRYPNSMLGAMFNGSMSSTKDMDGHYFIDRDGEMFSLVLNFMRCSRLALPEDFKHLDGLALEADFYQIEPLNQAIAKLRNKMKEASEGHGRLIEVIEVRTGSTATMPTNNSRVKTIISGRRDVINSLPSHFVGGIERLQRKSNADFTELELNGSNVRLRIAEYLQSHGWKLLDSGMSSSSGYDSKSMISSLIIEQSFRDRWFLATDREEDEIERKELECQENGMESDGSDSGNNLATQY